MWARYINSNHNISYSSFVGTVTLYHAVSYDPTLLHIDLDGKVNEKVLYHLFVTVNNTSTLNCYQV